MKRHAQLGLFFISLLCGVWLSFGACSGGDSCTKNSDCADSMICAKGVCQAYDGGTHKEVTSPDGKSEEMAKEKAIEKPLPDAGPQEPMLEKSSPDQDIVEDKPEEPPKDTGKAHQLKIFMNGDVTPIKFNDGLSGQTPKEFYVGIQKFEILRKPDDPNPVTIFDYKDGFKRTAMKGRALAGVGSLANIPSGTYVYGRVAATSMEFTIDATGHLSGMSLPGKLKVYYALSDHKGKDGKSYKQEDVSASFAVMGQTFPYNMKQALNFTPSDPQTWIETKGGKCIFYFPLGKKLIPGGTSADLETTLNFNIYEAFRWKDLTKPNYQPKVFDLTASLTDSEPVLRYGVNNYKVTVP